MTINDGVRTGRQSDSDRRDGPLLRGGSSRALSIDEALSLLVGERRRRLLLLLRERSPRGVDIYTATEKLAAIEGESRDVANDEAMREKIRTALRHAHIPKCKQVGVVEFSEDEEKLSYDSDPVLDMYLTLTEDITGKLDV